MSFYIVHQPSTKGGKLSIKTLKGALDASYDDNVKNVGSYIKDEDISSPTSKVFYDPRKNHAIVAHQGTSTALDWLNNLTYGLLGKKGYKLTPRFKQAKKVQDSAIEKYGAKNISTIGHSQAGLQAELLGEPTKEIITLNKATRPFGNVKHLNQYDVRTQRDIVSSLNPILKISDRDITIPSESYNPLEEHGIETLNRLEKQGVDVIGNE